MWAPAGTGNVHFMWFGPPESGSHRSVLNSAPGTEAGTDADAVAPAPQSTVLLPGLCRGLGSASVSAAQSGPVSDDCRIGPPASTRSRTLLVPLPGSEPGR